MTRPNLFVLLQHYPPCLIRLLARRKFGRPLTSGEIANQSLTPKTRLSHFQVETISQQPDWKGLDIYEIQAFLKGCNCDLVDIKVAHRINQYIRCKPSFRYLRADDQWKTYYLPLLQRWVASCTNLTNIHPPLRALLVRLKPIVK